MVISKKNNMKQRLATKNWLLATASVGISCLIISIILIFIDPILMLANYQLRLAKGTMLHNILLQEIEGAKLQIYLFNITNPERFLAGDDKALKMEEIGPFVYQEYRTNDDLELNEEPGVMRYSPNHRIELVLEESIGRPEDIELVLPNVALLCTVQMLSKYPFIVGQMVKMILKGMNMKALSKSTVQNYLWGNEDPFISLVNSVAPGIAYYNSTGILTRFYDSTAKYRLTLGTTDDDKFEVKSVEKFKERDNSTLRTKNLYEYTKTYTNAYEGAAFPPLISPTMPFKLYRYAICKTIGMEYLRTQQTEFGSEAFVYGFDKATFGERTLCDSKGWCPDGVMDLSTCYFGFPFAITRGHFLGTEPKMFEKIEGLKPNASLHSSTLTLDPKIGVTLDAGLSAQLSLALGDMSLLKETSMFSDMFVPVTHAIMKHPRLREEAKSSLRLMYTYGPYILHASQMLILLFGIILLSYSALMMHRHRQLEVQEKTLLNNQPSVQSESPLLEQKKPFEGI